MKAFLKKKKKWRQTAISGRANGKEVTQTTLARSMTIKRKRDTWPATEGILLTEKF